jgi:hypothetical protein
MSASGGPGHHGKSGRDATGPRQARRCAAQRADPANCRRGRVCHLWRRCANPGDRDPSWRRDRHHLPPFPTRSDLIIAVYRHQVEACAEAGPALLATADSPFLALRRWIDLFVDFLVTKHGLAGAMQSDSAGFDVLHAYFVDRLVPVCAELLTAAAAAGEARPGTDAYELMRGIGGLCATSESNSGYDPRKLVGLLLDGLQDTPT